MRPQHVVILLKILLSSENDWQYRDIAGDLNLSVSEVSESLHRSSLAGLTDKSKRKIFRLSLMEFIEHGLKYVFPQQPGSYVTGLPTAHSQAFFREHIVSELAYVWPDEHGNEKGLAIAPLYKGASAAAKKDEKLHKLLAAIDILRVGKRREVKLALEELRNAITI